MLQSSRFRVWRLALVSSLGSLGLLGCTGVFDGPDSNDLPAGSTPASGGGAAGVGGASVTGGQPAPGTPRGPTAGRRLTKEEFVNTVTDVLGPQAGVAAGRIQGESASQLRFRNDLSEVTVSGQRVSDYEEVAADIAEAVPAAALRAFAPCADATSACQTGFVAGLGSLLYRRPLSVAEVGNLSRLFEVTATTEAPFDRGASAILRAMLQSPHFLYKLEFQRAAPDGYEVATRLSFTLWKSGPDRGLLDAAQAGTLGSPGGTDAKALEMLSDPRARRGVREFGDDWLRVYNNLGRTPDPALGLSEPVFAAMRAESLRFVERILMDEAAPLIDLLTNRQTEFGPELAGLYGISVTPDGRYDFATVPTRVGLLTQLGVLGSRAGPRRASLVDRGLTIAEDFLCLEVPSPPPAAQALAAAFDQSTGDTVSQREKLAAHNSDPSCSGCHALIDPFGLPFENYDVAGRYSDTDEHGNRLYGNGDLTLDDQRQAYANVGEFATILAQSPAAKRCLIRKFTQYALGRKVATEDEALFESVLSNFDKSKGTYPIMVSSLATLGAFSFAAPEAFEAP